jgi:hypothetical protein
MPLVTIDTVVKSCLKAIDDLEGRVVKLEDAEKNRVERERNAVQMRSQPQNPSPPGMGKRARKKANKAMMANGSGQAKQQSSSSSASQMA